MDTLTEAKKIIDECAAIENQMQCQLTEKEKELTYKELMQNIVNGENKVQRKDVTEIAKQIFGTEIVVAAYQQVEEYRTDHGILDCTRIYPGEEPVIVEFVNGKKVLIWSSEWGGVTNDLENPYSYD